MKKIISLLLVIVLTFTYVSCGEYYAPTGGNDDSTDDPKNENGGSQGGEVQEGEPFVATVMLDGKAYTPPKVSDESLALKVRWSDGKTVHTAKVGADGKAECYGLDGDYAVTLVNLSDDYTYNPNIYRVNTDNRNVIIELLTLSEGRGDGTDLYKSILLSGTGVYRSEITYPEQIVYFEFTPTRAGSYSIESLVDVSAEMYDPVADVYYGSSQFKYYAYQLDGGGASQGYTTNFRHIVEVDEKFIGNSYTFGIFVNGKDATYPVNVDFAITYEGSYSYDWVVSNFVYPESIPNNSTYYSWYSKYVTYLSADRAKFGDKNFNMASTKIDGKNVFVYQMTEEDGTVKEYFKLNPDDGYYHVYDEVKYAAYGGWGPILYANISIPTAFIDTAFNEIEYKGNKNLTLSSGTENYKLFIEGYAKLVAISSDQNVNPYFCVKDCPCLATNGGACAIEDNCKKCTDDCRHIQAKYKNQKGYADIAIDGRCPVTEELKEFLQKYSVAQKLFSDGNGWAEQHLPRYDAYENSQWLFACGYYSS